MKLRTLVLGLCSVSAFAFAAHAESITIATVNNGDMIRMQKLTDDFTAKNPDIQLNWVTLEENVLRQRVTTDIATKGGQYRRHDHRHLRGSDLGQAGLAAAARQSRRRLRRRRHPAGHRRRPVRRRQALCRAVLRRELDDHVPHGPDGEGRAEDARRADLGIHRRRRPQDDRPRQRHQRHLPARQGRLGREHGLPDRHVQLLRRALVRRELEAPVRPAGVEGDARLLRRPDEGCRPAGRFLQRLQREPGAVPAGQVRHVDRRHRGGVLRDRTRRTPRSPTRSASRWRPIPVSASAATGSGPGRWPSRPARRRPKPPRSSSPGQPRRPISNSSPPRKAGPTFLRARAPRSTRTPSTRRRRPSPR